MSITAKVKKRVIDTGRIFDVLVQGENRSHKIIFAIPNETMEVSGSEVFLKDCYFYLLYKRKGDAVPQIPLLLTKTYDLSSDTISASFEPTSYFTEKEGALEVQVFACSTEESFITVDVDIEDIALWTTFAAQISISKSQLKNSQTIVAEDMFTKGIAEMSAYLDSAESEADDAEEYASDAEEFARGTRSDGLTVPHASTGVHDNAKDYKDLAKDWASKIGGAVESGEYSAKYYAVVSDTRSQEAEAYALGTKGGTPVPTFADKNAKDWATKTGSTVDGTNYSSKQYALNAKASADIVAEHATAIDSIYADLTNIDAVATDIQDDDSIINTVAENIQDVNTVAGKASEITTVAGIDDEVTTVAGIYDKVTTVAGIDDEVVAVAGIASDVSAVEDIKTDVSKVAAIDSDVSAVASIKDDVSTVADIDDDVTTVATDISDVSAVASDITKVTAVADDLTNIDAVADDLTNIDNAEANALKAEGWANGTQNGTPVSSDSPYYENNAKYWADAVPDLKSAITAIDHRVENLEQPKGGYDVQNYKDGSVTPSGKGAWAVVEGLRGVSRVENQLIPTLDNFSVYHCTKSVSDGVATISGFSGSDAQLYKNSVPMPIGQTALGALSIKPSKATMIRVSIGYSNIIAVVALTANVWTNLANVLTVSGSARNEFAIWLNVNGDLSTSDTVEVKSTIYSNLNIYFGTTDLSFLGATDSAKLATIQQNYPHLLTPSEYGTRIVDSSYSGVRAWSPNIWNEEWEEGVISSTTGEDSPSNSNIRSKNHFEVSPSKMYYLMSPNIVYIRQYDENKNFIATGNTTAKDSTFTTEPNCHFLKFFVISDYGNTYLHNIQIADNSLPDAIKTTYHPYMENTLSLSFQGKSAGSVYDSCELNVEVNGVAKKRTVQRIDSVDLGTLSWAKRDHADLGTYYYASAQNLGMAKPDSYQTGTANLLCAKYVPTKRSVSLFTDKSVCLDGDVIQVIQIQIKDSAYSDATAFKTSLDGVMLYYQKATPVVTLSDPLIDNTLLTESGGRMSTVQTGTVVDGSFDMGFITL